nr:immunoglobulin heavy chain junction region [Mus musculus]
CARGYVYWYFDVW